ncbi:MAG: transporter [Rhodospirillales bacterium]|nr:transporter [Rhodospirillales bacterium]
MSETRLELRDVTRTFEQAGERLEVLRGVNFSIRPGELVALVGPSGAGKSTLLHVAGLLEAPTSGTVLVNGEVAGDLDDAARTALRRRTIGFVYQFHHLLPEFSALENVIIPQMLNGRSKSEAAARAQSLLDRVGMGPRTTHRPARLSGGEQQRVAIVRALANEPALLLADEPTGNLDPHTADDAFAMLTDLVRSTGVGALIATHNYDLAGRMDRVLRLQDGKVESA